MFPSITPAVDPSRTLIRAARRPSAGLGGDESSFQMGLPMLNSRHSDWIDVDSEKDEFASSNSVVIPAEIDPFSEDTEDTGNQYTGNNEGAFY